VPQVYRTDGGRHNAAAEPLAITEAAAARLLSISPRALWELRREGIGPRHVRIGASVRYALAELRSWLDSKQAETATTATGKGGDA